MAAWQQAGSQAKALKFQLDLSKRKSQQLEHLAEDVRANLNVAMRSMRAEVSEMEWTMHVERDAHADTRAVLAALRQAAADKEEELLRELEARAHDLRTIKSAIDEVMRRLVQEEEKNKVQRERTRRATLQASCEMEKRREVEEQLLEERRRAQVAVEEAEKRKDEEMRQEQARHAAELAKAVEVAKAVREKLREDLTHAAGKAADAAAAREAALVRRASRAEAFAQVTHGGPTLPPVGSSEAAHGLSGRGLGPSQQPSPARARGGC